MQKNPLFGKEGGLSVHSVQLEAVKWCRLSEAVLNPHALTLKVFKNQSLRHKKSGQERAFMCDPKVYPFF
jgi:hypothetical protein